jgi:hypothetical protein
MVYRPSPDRVDPPRTTKKPVYYGGTPTSSSGYTKPAPKATPKPTPKPVSKPAYYGGTPTSSTGYKGLSPQEAARERARLQAANREERGKNYRPGEIKEGWVASPGRGVVPAAAKLA